VPNVHTIIEEFLPTGPFGACAGLSLVGRSWRMLELHPRKEAAPKADPAALTVGAEIASSARLQGGFLKATRRPRRWALLAGPPRKRSALACEHFRRRGSLTAGGRSRLRSRGERHVRRVPSSSITSPKRGPPSTIFEGSAAAARGQSAATGPGRRLRRCGRRWTGGRAR